jgi:two-component system nitrogen regulation response regulator GlnG/two-component system response regulator HydG
VTDETASIPDGEAFRPPPGDYETGDALVIVWAGEEWTRLGETAFFLVLGRTYSIGRGAESPAGHERAQWTWQRPGVNVPTDPLASPATSRDDLLVTPRLHGLDVQSVGKHGMLFRGTRVTHCHLEPGDSVIIDGQFMFRYSRRPLRMRPLAHFPIGRAGRFGHANAFNIVGETPELWELLDRAAFAAMLPDHVMIRGQTGSGKEAIAALIHALSSDASGPYVPLSIGDIGRNLIEDELFGHVKNHPQAGMKEKIGVIAEANGGILFLDEIGSMPFDAQSALLRVLDAGQYRQAGAQGHKVSRFRLLAAMNRADDSLLTDLRKRFGIMVWVSTLVARRDDIPLILRHLLRRVHAAKPALTQRFETRQADGSTEIVAPLWFVERLLQQESFEGNVRDLLTAMNDLLYPGGLPRPAPSRRTSEAPPAGTSEDAQAAAGEARGTRLTKEEVAWCLAKTGGNVKAAAEAAGVSRQAFYRAMKRTGVTGKEGE